VKPRKDRRDGLLPSVSTVKGVLSKDLIGWASWMVAKEAVLNQPAWRDFATAGEAIEFLRGAADRSRDDAAEHGTNVHALVESIAKGGEGGDTLEEEIAREFLRVYDASVVHSEFGVLNLTEGYGGAGDLIVRINGELWLVDVKTSNSLDISKKVDDWELQQAAYAYAELLVDKDEALVEVKFGSNSQHWYRPDAAVKGVMPAIERVGVLHIPRSQPEEWKLVELRGGRPEYDAFLAAKRVFDWRRYHGKQPKPTEVPVTRQEAA
jgi:hypothetical protein